LIRYFKRLDAVSLCNPLASSDLNGMDPLHPTSDLMHICPAAALPLHLPYISSCNKGQQIPAKGWQECSQYRAFDL